GAAERVSGAQRRDAVPHAAQARLPPRPLPRVRQDADGELPRAEVAQRPGEREGGAERGGALPAPRRSELSVDEAVLGSPEPGEDRDQQRRREQRERHEADAGRREQVAAPALPGFDREDRDAGRERGEDRKSTRLNSSHV